MISRRVFLTGAAMALAAPLPARALTPLNLDDVVLQPFALTALPGLEGVQVPSLDQLKGQVTVLNFWASWCASCRQEHHFLQGLKDKGVRLAGINASDENDPALRYLEKQGNPFAFVGVDDKKELAQMLGVATLPQTFLIGPNAQIVWQTSQGLDEDLVADLLAKAQTLKS